MNPDPRKCICQGRGAYFVAVTPPRPLVPWKETFDPLDHPFTGRSEMEVPCSYHSRAYPLSEKDRDVLKKAGIS